VAITEGTHEGVAFGDADAALAPTAVPGDDDVGAQGVGNSGVVESAGGVDVRA